MLFRKKDVIMSSVNGTLVDLPAPSNISYMWNFGSLLGVCLGVQFVSGLLLAMHFCADVSLAFNSFSHIMRDCNYGWLLRSLHANGASFFFVMIYIHIGRGLYMNSFKNWKLWVSGVLMLFILMAVAFLGYVLPWGQMSYWGATVITNLFSAIPMVGDSLTYWIWGGFSVSNATLTRFFVLHFFLPFVLVFFVILHIIYLHEKGSSNPLGVSFNIDKVVFFPYFVYKDIIGGLLYFILFLFVVLLHPNLFSDPENFISANSLVTPVHIQPEWYFLFAYAILRSIPNKLGGVVGLVLSILVLLVLSFSTRVKYLMPGYLLLDKIMYWYFIIISLVLTFLGACPIETPYLEVSQLFTMLYFTYFLMKSCYS